MGDVLVGGYKDIAAVAGLAVTTVQEQACTYPDPLPVYRLGDGSVVARESRIRSHRLRHAPGAVHPVAGLALLREWTRIAPFVHLSVSRAMQLAPWGASGGADPLPVFHLGGTVAAYQDALADWFDRRKRAAGSPRFQRAWGGLPRKKAATKEERRGKRGRGLPVTASARSEKKAPRVPATCQEASTEVAK